MEDGYALTVDSDVAIGVAFYVSIWGPVVLGGLIFGLIWRHQIRKERDPPFATTLLFAVVSLLWLNVWF